MSEPTEIDLAAYALLEAKAAEEQARNARLAAEKHLIELIGVKDEGTVSKKTAYYKVVTTGKLTRTLVAASDMPDAVYHAITRVKHELDVKALKALATADPRAYQEALRYVSTKPAKPAVKVEQIPQQQQEAA